MKWPSPKISRDSILLGVGLAGLGYETISGRADPTLIVAFVGMLGLPAFIRTDEARRNPPPPAAVIPFPAPPAPPPPPPVPETVTERAA